MKEYQHIQKKQRIRIVGGSRFFEPGTIMFVVEVGTEGFAAADTMRSGARYSYTYDQEGGVWERYYSG